jgi:hypothetical protein
MGEEGAGGRAREGRREKAKEEAWGYAVQAPVRPIRYPWDWRVFGRDLMDFYAAAGVIGRIG